MTNPVTRLTLVVSVDAAGAGTVTSAQPVNGRVVEVRMPNAGTALTSTGGTTDFTLTRATCGGTILSAANQNAPWQYQPAQAVHSTSAGTSAFNTGVGPVYLPGVPVDDYVTLTVAAGQPSQSGTVYVHVHGRAW